MHRLLGLQGPRPELVKEEETAEVGKDRAKLQDTSTSQCCGGGAMRTESRGGRCHRTGGAREGCGDLGGKG